MAKEHASPLPPPQMDSTNITCPLAWPPLPDLCPPLGSRDPSRGSAVKVVGGCGPLTPADCVALGKSPPLSVPWFLICTTGL